MKSLLIVTLLVSGNLFLNLPANAASKPPKAAALPTESIPAFSEEEFQKIMAEAKKYEASRKVANVDRVDYATAVADDFKNITSALVGGSEWKDQKEVPGSNQPGVQSNADLAAKIDSFESKYATLSPASQILAAQLIALKPFRGIVYRLRPLVEKQRTPFVHGMIIAFIRAVNAGVNNVFPTDQWKAGFDYLTQPYPNMGAQITSEHQLNAYLSANVLPAFYALFKRVQGANLSTPVYMDNRLLWNTANFVADQDRFVLFGNTEKLTYLSNIAFGIAGIVGSQGYNWVGLFETTQKFWTVYGFNTFAQPDNMTAEQRVKVIRKNDELFTLLDGGEAFTKAAYQWFILGVRYGRKSWNSIQASQSDSSAQNTVLDQRGFLPFIRVINKSFTNVEDVIEGKGVASSVVGGEVVDVNFKKFFHNPPKDFKKFLPTAFDDGPASVKEPVTGIMYRNYSRGNPTGWDIGAYQAYFPNVKTAADVKRAARVMNQTWGPTLLGLPLSTMMF